MKATKALVSAIVLLGSFSTIAAQTRTLSGRVTVLETAESLQGAQVFVKDTFIGTTADANGRYTLELPAGEINLVVAFIGYKTQEIIVGLDVEELNIELEGDVLRSEEIIVTGLASSVKRRNLAHSVATISADDLLPAPAQTLDAALSGKFAGITVRQNTGAPGGGMSVNLRAYPRLRVRPNLCTYWTA